jgi:pyridoxamine 5'-phosphate oxidase
VSTASINSSKKQSENDPFLFFDQWFQERIRTFNGEVHAVALSTADLGGKVSSRIVLVKIFNSTGFYFFTNYESRKGKQIADNPNGSLLYYWPELKRQVRIEGIIEKAPADLSDQYFASRPAGNRISSVISPQSTEIKDLKQLKEKFSLLTQNTGELSLTRPANWGGYRLIPSYFEFWEEGEYRLHDRITYSLKKSRWHTGILAP